MKSCITILILVVTVCLLFGLILNAAAMITLSNSIAAIDFKSIADSCNSMNAKQATTNDRSLQENLNQNLDSN